MGMHTWFHNTAEDYENYLSSEEWEDTQMLYKKCSTDFHDCFRTNKRELNGNYCLDEIRSEEECKKWIEENKESIYYIDQEQINKFWQQYPNGLIRFG